ncbi:hypothetical protein BDV26DRAFT_125698 [Aspergillus bertholletiae]|uniref:Uncharacterized protein n=1 Tax=Aspergillus bertholletiae TaxID=1226010 RepID=A0A5N7APN0_9EURO|nr:hypothetical protein BDV26DRAFT_136384 [Aspergillus bertholletiae]KAE8371542.1 hypothetical protein BDV26DRAFT_125698 [Aspergillus bertholletiae]
MSGASPNPWVDYIKEVVAHRLPRNNQSNGEADFLSSDQESCGFCPVCQEYSSQFFISLKVSLSTAPTINANKVQRRVKERAESSCRRRPPVTGGSGSLSRRIQEGHPVLNQTLNEMNERTENEISAIRQYMAMIWDHVKSMRAWTTEAIGKLRKGQEN